MRGPPRAWGAAVLAIGLAAALCRPAFAIDDVRAERQRIAAERAAAESAFAARAAECDQRFAVTDCMKAAQRERRDALDRLNRQTVVLDEDERRQRAAQRIEAIRRKVAADEASQRARGPAVAASAQLRLREPVPRGAAKRDGAGRAKSPSRREAERLERQSSQVKRRAEMQAHRAEVERRNQARAASGKPAAAPLPVPGGPAASSAGR